MSPSADKPGNNRPPSRPRIFLRKHSSFPSPAARPATLDMDPVVGFTVAGRAPPPPDHLPVPPAPDNPKLSLDVHLAALRGEETLLAIVSLPMLALAGLLLWFGSFVLAALLVALVSMAYLATHYAKRPRIVHRLARVLRAVFYVSFTYPGDRRPPRLSLRLSVIVAAVLFLALLRFAGGLFSP